MDDATTATVLGAVEALFGAGTTVAPMPGATLLRYLHRLDDAWSNGLHLDAPPSPTDLADRLDTWEAFERPGRVRWVAEPGVGVTDALRPVVVDRGLAAAARPVFHGHCAAAATSMVPDGVEVSSIGGDIRDWAGFEVLARWIDLDDDPARWWWRAQRVRNLVQGSRGAAVLARVPSAPVGAAARLRAPDHRPGVAPVVACVVHQAHRGRRLAAALVAHVAVDHDGPVTLLGDAAGHLARAAGELGLDHVADLVEVAPRPDPTGRKA